MSTSSDPPPPRRGLKSVPDGEDWPEYRHHVLENLDDLKRADERQDRVLQRIETQIAVLQTRVTLYAVAASALIATAVEVVAKVVFK